MLFALSFFLSVGLFCFLYVSLTLCLCVCLCAYFFDPNSDSPIAESTQQMFLDGLLTSYQQIKTGGFRVSLSMDCSGKIGRIRTASGVSRSGNKKSPWGF